MTEPVRVIRAAELQGADPTPGMTRARAFETETLWAGRVVTVPGAVSGWHHHDRNETSLYVVFGVLRLEFEGYDGHLDAEAGDFVHVPAFTVHRESNPTSEPSVAVIARAGGGVPTVNVDDPRSAPTGVDLGSEPRGVVLGEEPRKRLGIAAYGGDGEQVVEVLHFGPWPADSLQMIGDGLVGALAQRVEGADELARECAEALRDRDWEGDAELADCLESRLGAGPAALLRPLPVNLEELSSALEGDPAEGGGRIDLHTGEVWPESVIEYSRESGELTEDDAEDDERWLMVDCMGSRPGYRDMESFIAGLDDADKADRLSIAIEGRGAFRRFKDQLARWTETFDQWYAFSADRQRGRARAWLAEEGYVPSERSR